MHAAGRAGERPLSAAGRVDEQLCATESHAQRGDQHLCERVHGQIRQHMWQGLHLVPVGFQNKRQRQDVNTEPLFSLCCIDKLVLTSVIRQQSTLSKCFAIC